MKRLELTEESAQLVNAICDKALKNAGLEVYGLVKKLELWLHSAVDEEEKKEEDAK